SAGCGSAMKEYGAWSADLESVSRRVLDVRELLHLHDLAEALGQAPGLPIRTAYQAACHLAHGQRIRLQPRELIAAIPGLTLMEMDEPDMCCGSAGTYNSTRPAMARRLLERKWASVSAVQPDVLITGNPGCHA